MNHMVTTKKAKVQFNWQDPFLIEQQLSPDERMIRDAAHAYCQERLQPVYLNNSVMKQQIHLFSVKWESLAYLAQPFLSNMAARV